MSKRNGKKYYFLLTLHVFWELPLTFITFITHIRTLFKSRIPISENLWKLDRENVLKYGFTVLCFVRIESTSSFLGA